MAEDTQLPGPEQQSSTDAEQNEETELWVQTPHVHDVSDAHHFDEAVEVHTDHAVHEDVAPGDQESKTPRGQGRGKARSTREAKPPGRGGQGRPVEDESPGREQSLPKGKETGVRTSLRSLLQAKQSVTRHSIEEIRVGRDPARVVLFCDNTEVVTLHWEDDATARGFYHCPGPGCPACALGEEPTTYYLVPAFAVAFKSVGILRVSDAEGPCRLATLLAPLLDDPEIHRKLITIRRDGGRYQLDVVAVREGLTPGAEAIEQFLESFEEGRIRLADTFTSPTVNELRAIPRIANQLDLLEGPVPSSPVSRLGRPNSGDAGSDPKETKVSKKPRS